MSISSLVIHTRPDVVDAVRSRLAGFEGVEVHATTEDGRMVVTVDRPGDRAAAETLSKCQEVDGVLSASLVYNYFEPDDADEEKSS